METSVESDVVLEHVGFINFGDITFITLGVCRTPGDSIQ